MLVCIEGKFWRSHVHPELSYKFPRFFWAQNQELNDPVMGGKSTGTWHVDAAKFVGIFDGEVHKRWATGEGVNGYTPNDSTWDEESCKVCPKNPVRSRVSNL